MAQLTIHTVLFLTTQRYQLYITSSITISTESIAPPSTNAQHEGNGEVNQEYIAELSTSNSVDRNSCGTATKIRITSESLWFKTNISLNERQKEEYLLDLVQLTT
jgi:hypothetical protein